MELPILLAVDTTERWEHSDTVLGKSELAIELAPQGIDSNGCQTYKKHLLIGDGLPAGPNAGRLRATPELIAGLPETLQGLAAAIAAETSRAEQAEAQLQHNIDTETSRAEQAEAQLQHNIDTRETFHDDTITGKGIAGDPLSVVPGAQSGITVRITLAGDGAETAFPLPEDFLFGDLSIVEVNGIGQEPGADYTLDEQEGSITFAEAPEEGDTVTVYYTNKNGGGN